MSHNVGDASKLLGIGQNKLFKLLRENGVFTNRNLPKQQYISQKLFEVKSRSYVHPVAGLNLYGKTLITDKGIAWLAVQFDLQMPEILED